MSPQNTLLWGVDRCELKAAENRRPRGPPVFTVSASERDVRFPRERSPQGARKKWTFLQQETGGGHQDESEQTTLRR